MRRILQEQIKELENIKYNGITNDLAPLLEEYEFFSILKKMNIKQEPKEEKPLEYKIINSLEETNIKETRIEHEHSITEWWIWEKTLATFK